MQFFSVVILLFNSKSVYASFGVSPAGLTYDYLQPGMKIEREFLLSRTNIDQEDEVIVENDLGEASGWITIKPGNSFIFEKGKSTQSMKIIINVPEDAQYKEYTGDLILKVSQGVKTAGVSIVQGVDITANLTVTKLKFAGLLIRKLDIPDIFIGEPIRLILTTENTGNQIVAPERVEIRVKNISGADVFQDKVTDIESVNPGDVKELSSVFENDLGVGEYKASVSAYFLEKTIGQDQLVFSVKDKAENMNEEFRVLNNNEDNWNSLFRLVLISIVPSVLVWGILRKKYENS